MIKKTLGFFFLLFTFLSFVVTTYEPPWRNSSMEFFAFLAIISIVIKSSINMEKMKLNSVSIFFFVFIFISALTLFFKPEIYMENFWLAVIFSFFAILIISSAIDFSEKIIENYLISVVLAASFSAFIIYCQYFEIYDHLDIWKAGYQEVHGRPYANFGQPNLAASLILTGVCCTVFFYEKAKIGKIATLAIALFMAGALAFASSKTSFLSILVLIFVLIFFRNFFESLIFIVIGIAVFSIKKIFETRDVLGEGDLSTGRFELWATIFEAFLNHPWVGYGVLNTREAHFEVIERHVVTHGVIIGSSHNIFLDFIIWFGLPLGMVVIFLWGKIHLEFFRENRKNISLLIIPIPLLIHSLLEYPLFNANFFFFYIIVMTIGLRKNIKTKIPVVSFSVLPFTLFFIAVWEYSIFSSKYRDLRFFNSGFLKSEKPQEMQSFILSDLIGQYNIFLTDEIKSEAEFKNIVRITKKEPLGKNFCLIYKYISDNNMGNDIFFWERKANVIFKEEELNYIDSCKKN